MLYGASQAGLVGVRAAPRAWAARMDRPRDGLAARL